MIILASVVVISLSQNNPIESAKIATLVQKVETLESGITMHVSVAKVNTFGTYSIEQILTGNLGATEKYALTKGNLELLLQNSNEIEAYELDKEKVKKLLNIDITSTDSGVWCVDKNGKVYIGYAAEEIPSYLKNDSNPGSQQTNIPQTLASAVAALKDDKITASKLSNMTIEQKQEIIGKKVIYEGANGYNDWRILYSNGTNIVIIAADLINPNILPEGHGFDIWAFSAYDLNKNRDNFSSNLEKETTFNGFKDTQNGSPKAKSARIPTIEDFCDSYNSVEEHSGTPYSNSTKINTIYYKKFENGYRVSTDVKGTTSNENIPNNSYSTENGIPRPGKNQENLWILPSKNTGVNFAEGYWLNSYSAFNNTFMMVVTSAGNLTYSGTDNKVYGLRPVVVLKPNAALVEVERENENEEIRYNIV